ncbi:hypothetical protein D9M73_254030 [compost metagenome]
MQGQATWLQWLCAGVEKAHAQGTEHACASVVGRAATDGQDDLFGPCRHGLENQLPGPVGRAVTGIALRRREQLQATGFSHFNNGGTRLRQPTPARRHFGAQGATDGGLAPLTVGGRQNRLHRALAAIGHRALHHLCLG